MQIKFLLFRSLQNLALLLQRDIKFLLKFPKSNIFKNVYLECSSCFYILKHFLYISISEYSKGSNCGTCTSILFGGQKSASYM